MSKKIVVAMSGGVDSSVAAALLKEQGYDVIGVTLRLANWEETETRSFGGCCGSTDFYDARSVAQKLDIPHYSFNYVETFQISVIDYFKDSYLKGETPNPCIACNKHVKFDVLIKHAQALGAEAVATGHYARLRSSEDGVELRTAVDDGKDQSYVLYHLGQHQLKHLMFPVGEYAKPNIREIARELGFVTADKPDSQEICFVPNSDYKLFLKEQVPAGKIQGGEIRHKDGTYLGMHDGLPFYTIGQRSGLGIAVGRPLYVVGLETETNTLVVGEKEDVLSQDAQIREVSWVSGRAPSSALRCSAKIRYKHHPVPATVEPAADGLWSLRFDQPQSAVTPGQAAVFYDGDKVLGGGVIHHVNH